MRIHWILTVAAAMAVGCASKPEEPVDSGPDEAELNRLFIRAAQEQNARSAIIAERTIYDHHFDPATARLNHLGERQVQVLADAYKSSSARIHIAQGEASDELYQLRVQAVRDEFARLGMASEGLSFDDGNPSGPGISSLRVWQAYTAEQNRQMQMQSGSGENGSGDDSGLSGELSGSSSNGGSR